MSDLVTLKHVNWRGFRTYMETIDGQLQADSPKFKGTALVIHHEGMLLQNGASVEVHEVLNGDKASDFVLVVFGEHMQATHFDLEMVSGWSSLTLHRRYEVMPPEPDEE